MREAIEILKMEMQSSQHFASYPQDRHKNKEVTIEILITTSEYHKIRANDLSKAISILEKAESEFKTQKDSEPGSS